MLLLVRFDTYDGKTEVPPKNLPDLYEDYEASHDDAIGWLSAADVSKHVNQGIH